MENTIFNELRVMPVLMLMLGEYVMVLFAVVADLVSGLRKAKLRVEALCRKALRRTVDILCRYYNALFAMSVIDVMQMAAVAYMSVIGAARLPMLPVFTLFGAICIAIIEVKSIYEKASDKEKSDAEEAAHKLLRLVRELGIGEKGGAL